MSYCSVCAPSVCVRCISSVLLQFAAAAPRPLRSCAPAPRHTRRAHHLLDRDELAGLGVLRQEDAAERACVQGCEGTACDGRSVCALCAQRRAETERDRSRAPRSQRVRARTVGALFFRRATAPPSLQQRPGFADQRNIKNFLRRLRQQCMLGGERDQVYEARVLPAGVCSSTAELGGTSVPLPQLTLADVFDKLVPRARLYEAPLSPRARPESGHGGCRRGEGGASRALLVMRNARAR